MDSTTAPLFTALSTSARQLYYLLRCISFNPKAEVQITPDGLRFTVEEARVISGNLLLSKDLFSSYTFKLPPGTSSEAQFPIPPFQISLSALLETLAIFSVSDNPGPTSTSYSSYRHPSGGFTSSTAFNTPALHLSTPTCALTYSSPGSPLRILISDPITNITTTCDLMTFSTAQYDLGAASDDDIDSAPTIPLDRAAIVFKAILRAAYLADAISELAAIQPDVLAISASATSAPYFQFEGEGGPFGDASVDFTPFASDSETRSHAHRSKRTPLVTETFSVGATGRAGRVRQKYKFELVHKAGRAMAGASKVSVRLDQQGVLSLQFMVEVGGGAEHGGQQRDRGVEAQTQGEPKVCFVEYRFVPLVDDDDDDDDEEGGDDGEDGEDEEENL